MTDPHHHHELDQDHTHEDLRQVEERLDPASRSLANALHVSFRLLTLIMILVAAVFVLTGLEAVQPNQFGIVKVFGRQVRLARPGLVFNWPFPIGEIEIVDAKERSIQIEDFWLYIEPRNRTREIDDLPMPRGGLRPGWDGAVLTGDRNLLHLLIVCSYRVTDPVAFARNVRDLEAMVRDAVCRATVQASGTRTGDGIKITATGAFADEVRTAAQEQLDLLLGRHRAVEITRLNVPQRIWPLRARPAYAAAQEASQEKQKILDSAVRGAKEILLRAAGASYERLVGRPWERLADVPTEPGEIPEQPLLDRYALAEQRDPREAAELLDQINGVLLSGTTGGEASTILSAANAYYTATVQGVRSRVELFEQLLPEYQRNPEFMRDRLWASVWEEVLDGATTEKVVLPFSGGKTVVRISRDPTVARELMRERLRGGQDRNRPGQSPAPPRP